MTQTPGYGIWTTDLDGNRVVGFTPAQMLAVTQERDELLAALQAAVECGMVPTSSASEGGASKYVRQLQVADLIRAAIQKATNKAAAIGAHKEGD